MTVPDSARAGWSRLNISLAHYTKQLRSELPADSACFRSRRRHRRDGKRRGRVVGVGSAGGGDVSRGTHFGAADRAGPAGAQRGSCGATAKAVRTAVRTCPGLGGAAHECAKCAAAARRGRRRARGREACRSQRVRRGVDDAARAHRCRTVRISGNNGGGSAACACCCEREQCRASAGSCARTKGADQEVARGRARSTALRPATIRRATLRAGARFNGARTLRLLAPVRLVWRSGILTADRDGTMLRSSTVPRTGAD